LRNLLKLGFSLEGDRFVECSLGLSDADLSLACLDVLLASGACLVILVLATSVGRMFTEAAAALIILITLIVILETLITDSLEISLTRSFHPEMIPDLIPF
jgi:hypothetical protein